MPPASRRPSRHRERQLQLFGYQRIAGVDEAGRGPLAGPVVAGAVVLPARLRSKNGHLITDSKLLPADTRALLYAELTATVQWGVGVVDAATIDVINIRQAAWQAMRLAVTDLMTRHDCGVDYVLIDGLGYGPGPWPYEAIIKGDLSTLAIAAASIIAKETRDRIMIEFDRQFPEYGFVRHKGYYCPEHVRSLDRHGPCPIHRMSFAPLRADGEVPQPAEEEAPLETAGLV